MTSIKNKLLHNSFGDEVFANFPNLSKHGFPAGTIKLKHGEHKGIHSGFGFHHIWKEHFSHIDNETAAQTYIIERLQIKLKFGMIYHEHGKRNIIFKPKEGVVILQLTYDGTGNPFYNVITCFSQGNPHGIRIGQLG